MKKPHRRGFRMIEPRSSVSAIVCLACFFFVQLNDIVSRTCDAITLSSIKGIYAYDWNRLIPLYLNETERLLQPEPSFWSQGALKLCHPR